MPQVYVYNVLCNSRAIDCIDYYVTINIFIKSSYSFMPCTSKCMHSLAKKKIRFLILAIFLRDDQQIGRLLLNLLAMHVASYILKNYATRAIIVIKMMMLKVHKVVLFG